MAFTYREGLGRPLTWLELDANFQYVEDLADSASDSASSASGSASIASDSASNAADSSYSAAAHEEQAQIYAAAAQSAVGVPALAGNSGKALVVMEDEQGVEWGLPDAVQYVQTIDDLALIQADSLKDGHSAQVVSTGRAGLFRWTAGDLSAECAADQLRISYIPAEGDSGSQGAWVKSVDPSSVLDQQSMVERAQAIASTSGHYLIKRSTTQIGIGCAHGGGQGVEYQMRIDDDGMLLMRGGIAAEMTPSGLPVNATDLTGNFVTSPTSSTGNYTTDIGATFALDFSGTGLVFHHFSDTRGGLWEFNIDGGAVIVNVSTYWETGGVRQTVVVEGLSDEAHTCVATFLGDDPANTPSATARGWLILPVTVGYSTGTAIVSGPWTIVGAGARRSLISTSSIPEFAINVVPSGSGLAGTWVPQHGAGGIGACRNVMRKIFVDGEETAPDLSEISEIARTIKTMTILQSYTAYNANDAAGDYPLWDGLIAHRYEDGVLAVTHKIRVTGEFSSTAGYLNMFPSDSRYANEFRTPDGFSKGIAAVDLDTPAPFALSAAFLDAAAGDAVAFDWSPVTGGHLASGKPFVPGETFLQERVASNVAKFYLSGFSDGDVVSAGSVFGTKARYMVLAANAFADML